MNFGLHLFSRRRDLLDESDQAVKSYQAIRVSLQREKDEKLDRKIELSITAFNVLKSSLQEQSLLVDTDPMAKPTGAANRDIDFLVKKMAYLDDYIRQLRVARYHLEQGNVGASDEIVRLLEKQEKI
jgi:hypothetical protein